MSKWNSQSPLGYYLGLTSEWRLRWDVEGYFIETELPDGWIHIVATYDYEGTQSLSKLYTNGLLKSDIDEKFAACRYQMLDLE